MTFRDKCLDLEFIFRRYSGEPDAEVMLAVRYDLCSDDLASCCYPEALIYCEVQKNVESSFDPITFTLRSTL